jgi:hypothetical protein
MDSMIMKANRRSKKFAKLEVKTSSFEVSLEYLFFRLRKMVYGKYLQP